MYLALYQQIFPYLDAIKLPPFTSTTLYLVGLMVTLLAGVCFGVSWERFWRQFERQLPPIEDIAPDNVINMRRRRMRYSL